MTANNAQTALKHPEPVEIDTQKPTRFGMLKKFSLLVNIFFAWVYDRVVHEPSQVQEVLAIPRNEAVVYLLASENKHDFLFLNDLCLKTGMPLAFTSNGKSKLRYATLARCILGLFSKHKKMPSVADIAQCVLERRTILLFLNQYGIHERQNTIRTEEIFEAMRQISAAHPDLKIHFVPVGIIWERRAESYKHTLFNEIYGTPTRPSSIRRFLTLLLGIPQLFFQIGKPLCLIHPQSIDLAKFNNGAEVKRFLNDDIDLMHTQVNGPKFKPHQQLLREIVSSEPFQQELQAISQTTGQSQDELVHEARKILDKTASKFSLLVCKLFCAFFTPMWSTIYNGLYIDSEKLNEIRELSKTHRLVFIPSHKSHIDYLVLSILLFQNGVLPPHIAAGENLNFFPVGSILRRGGAFFIKRSFRGQQLYAACVKHYIDKILHEGYPVEFFIEGGRSRTGQVLQPKSGILRMIAQAIEADPKLPVLIIPCAITYEKVIEDMAYKNEQDGAVKQRENITNLIKTTKLLISKYGQIYVSFAQPIDFNKALHLDPASENAGISEADMTKYIDEMAIELMSRINRASTITTSSLLSCAILNADKEYPSFDAVLENAAFILSLLIQRHALISPVLQTALAASRASLHKPEFSEEMPAITEAALQKHEIDTLLTPLRRPLAETIKLFENNGTIRRHKDDRLDVAESGRLQIAFYKNILLFALIDDIYLACALLSLDSTAVARETLSERFSMIAELFSIEFSPYQTGQRFKITSDMFVQRGWLETNEGDMFAVREDAAPSLEKLSRCIAPHSQSYRFVFAQIAALHEPQEESKITEQLLSEAKTAVSAHEMLPEARSKVVFSHALQKLQDLGVFEVSYEQTGRKHAKFLKPVAQIPEHVSALLARLTSCRNDK
ncbi:MAG: 1-acyl-sn-glycerol-3-phosphate acyltransferase [Proteobacteria bacterium]|nr:1-acyl-sn-glycerol-3-phosphate acyltransferase [Pseudomonadota bacterium]